MKKTVIIIFVVAISFLVISNYYSSCQKSDIKTENISENPDSLKKYSGLGSSYIAKGLLYLGIAIILLIVWLLLHYKF